MGSSLPQMMWRTQGSSCQVALSVAKWGPDLLSQLRGHIMFIPYLLYSPHFVYLANVAKCHCPGGGTFADWL